MGLIEHFIGWVAAVVIVSWLYICVFLPWGTAIIFLGMTTLLLAAIFSMIISLIDIKEQDIKILRQQYNRMKMDIDDIKRMAYNSLDSVTMILDDYNNMEDRVDGKISRLRKEVKSK